MGHAPQSFAKAASERIRSGLSPKTINSSAAVLAPTPKLARRVGQDCDGPFSAGPYRVTAHPDSWLP